MNAAEIVVIGAGVMGLATAQALVLEGHDVLLVEQFQTGHARGSSHGKTRVLRLSYPNAKWVRLVQEALPLWRKLEQEAGERFLSRAGTLDLGIDLELNQQALADCGASFEVLDAEEVERRYGLLVLPEVQGLLQPDGGVLSAERAQLFLLASATAHGLRLLEGTRVHGLETESEEVRLETSAGTIAAGVAVVTAGSWAGALLGPVGIDLSTRATRESVGYFRVGKAWQRPVVLDWATPQSGPDEGASRGRLIYALPDSETTVKVGLDRSGRPTDPDEVGCVDEELVQCVAGWLERCVGIDAPRLARAETCIYTNTLDDRFVLERRGRVVVGAACDGHGFKFAPVIGQRLASLAVEAGL